MSKIITPTVGRKVWYRPAAFDLTGVGAMNVAHDQPLDATVIAVWGDRCINAEVKDVTGKHFVKMSATLVQDGDALPMQGPKDAEGNATPGGYFQWMPYQQAQTAKDAPAETPVAEPDPKAEAVLHTEDPDHVQEEQPAVSAA